MKLISWNVNGLRSIISKNLDEFISMEAPDILCLQEIKAHPEQLEGTWSPPSGYSCYWNPAERKGYSGTLTLTKIPAVSVQNGIGEPIGDAEGRVLTIEYEKFFLVNVYTPNAKGDLSRLEYRHTVWDVAFRQYISKLSQVKPAVFCGDLNVAHEEIDLANPKSNKKNAGFTQEERDAFSEHLDVGFVDTFRMFNSSPGNYSWWSYRAGARSRNVGWRIDYVCVSENGTEMIEDAFILSSIMGSDHCPVGVSLTL